MDLYIWAYKKNRNDYLRMTELPTYMLYNVYKTFHIRHNFGAVS